MQPHGSLLARIRDRRLHLRHASLLVNWDTAVCHGKLGTVLTGPQSSARGSKVHFCLSLELLGLPAVKRFMSLKRSEQTMAEVIF